MAAPAYRAASAVTSNNGSGGTTCVITRPVGVTDGDIVILWVYWENNSAVTITPPAGFTEITACAVNNTGSNPALHVRVYWKRAASEIPSYTVTLSLSSPSVCQDAAYTGAVATGTPIEAGNQITGNNTSCTLPSITTLTADTLIIGHASSFDWTKTWSSSALTERIDNTGAATYDIAQATAGASGTKLITQSATDQFGGTILNIASTAVSGTQYTQSASGGITPAATIAKRPASTKTGAMTSGGALARMAATSKTGSITPAGSVVKQIARALAGGLTPAGALAAIKTVLRALSGALSSAGSLIRRTAALKGGSVEPAGALTRQTYKAFIGTLTSGGALGAIKTVLKALSGALTSSGALARRIGRTLAGTFSSAGTQTRQTIKGLAGSLASSGALAPLRTVLMAMSGSLTSTGALLRQTSKRLVGGLSPTGSLARMAAKALAGVLTTAGALVSALNGYVPVIVRDLVTGISYITRSRTSAGNITRQQADTAYITRSNSRDTEF